MAKYLCDSASLDKIASAIRSKTGKKNQLTFPNEFISEINGIKTGGDIKTPAVSYTLDNNMNVASANFYEFETIPTSILVNLGALTTVTFSNVASKLTIIGGSAFENCGSLVVKNLPETLVWIQSAAFRKCKSYDFTTLPETLTTIEGHAFDGLQPSNPLSGLSKIPSQLGALYSKALPYFGIGISALDIPSSVVALESECICGGSPSLTINFKGTPQSIDAKAFIQAGGITTINVPWAEGAVANAPWGATNATINYGVKA